MDDLSKIENVEYKKAQKIHYSKWDHAKSVINIFWLQFKSFILALPCTIEIFKNWIFGAPVKDIKGQLALGM